MPHSSPSAEIIAEIFVEEKNTQSKVRYLNRNFGVCAHQGSYDIEVLPVAISGTPNGISVTTALTGAAQHPAFAHVGQ